MPTIISQNTPIEDREKELIEMLENKPDEIFMFDTCIRRMKKFRYCPEECDEGEYEVSCNDFVFEKSRVEMLQLFMRNINKFNDIIIVP